MRGVSSDVPVSKGAIWHRLRRLSLSCEQKPSIRRHHLHLADDHHLATDDAIPCSYFLRHCSYLSLSSVNGICTSPSGLRLIITALQNTFHRPITGLNNRTFGFWFDFLECLVQRDLFWPTQDLRTGYKVRLHHAYEPRLRPR